jgi:hypothetical protein
MMMTHHRRHHFFLRKRVKAEAANQWSKFNINNQDFPFARFEAGVCELPSL